MLIFYRKFTRFKKVKHLFILTELFNKILKMFMLRSENLFMLKNT